MKDPVSLETHKKTDGSTGGPHGPPGPLCSRRLRKGYVRTDRGEKPVKFKNEPIMRYNRLMMYNWQRSELLGVV